MRHETDVRQSRRGESIPSQNEESLGNQAYRVLRRALRDGLIQPDRYYSESELAELLGVSRTPVREALKRLERDGVLKVASRRGYKLRSFSEQEVDELVELRKVLEHFAIAKLISDATDQDLARLAEVFKQQESGDIETEIFALDEEFHLTIAELAGLPRTREILAALRSAMAVISAGAHVSRDRTERVVEEHHQLLDAISRRDRQAAVDILDRHVEESTKALLEGKRLRTAQRSALRLVGK